ncbi:Actin cross-linking [Cynara cardunculus var. scolymus]|uniref:Actin cross-linking n=1 Tax=Cynara cardunculus var. scolymus TaxID=59895 RepID=A0A103YDX1_CYNCS|nr:Actin cross-linking [Cynara cardunculus var. scolymus]
MKTPNTKNQLLGIICVFAIFVISNGRSRTMNSNNQKIRAVNLGGWLVTEGWMKPSLFDSIPNKDFLDGAGLQFKSATIGKFLCAELGGGTIIVANRTSASGWETFRLWRIDETNFHLRVFNKEFLGLDSNGINLVAVSTNSETSGIFEIIKKSDDSSHVRIKAPNGLFLQAKTEDSVTADSNGDGQWRDDDPSVFEMTKVETMRGEYQVTNGYGPTKAPKIMKVILDLHAAPGSQNGYEHSSGRDGFIEWGLTDETIRQTVDVIEFFTARYAKNPSLYAVELINEPRAPGVPLSVLTKYYEAGYKVVRKHAPNAFVVLSNRLSGEPKELFPVASGMKHVVVDVHYYNLFSDIFNDMTVEQNIDFIQTNRSAELQAITTANGPRIFVGEWVAEWQVRGATKQDFQRFSEAQLEVWGRASFGWAYWSLKNVNNHWSMDWMIKNGYINL